MALSVTLLGPYLGEEMTMTTSDGGSTAPRRKVYSTSYSPMPYAEDPSYQPQAETTTTEPAPSDPQPAPQQYKMQSSGESPPIQYTSEESPPPPQDAPQPQPDAPPPPPPPPQEPPPAPYVAPPIPVVQPELPAAGARVEMEPSSPPLAPPRAVGLTPRGRVVVGLGLLALVAGIATHRVLKRKRSR